MGSLHGSPTKRGNKRTSRWRPATFLLVQKSRLSFHACRAYGHRLHPTGNSGTPGVSGGMFRSAQPTRPWHTPCSFEHSVGGMD
jgi:hypothetical protein